MSSRHRFVQVMILMMICGTFTGCAQKFENPFAGFAASPCFSERTLEFRIEPGIRVFVEGPPESQFDAKRPTLLVFYALPNGNTIEQTMGKRRREGVNWHFDIQHIAAQTRLLREADPKHNYVTIYLEADGRSWPSWRGKHSDAPARVRACVDEIRAWFMKSQSKPPRVAITGHSGGGAFIWAFIDASDSIPDYVDRIALLDANYSFDDEEHKHGAKFAAWLRGGRERHLIVVCYDDRNITLNGKKIITSDTGGTWRATLRMVASLEQQFPFKETEDGGFIVRRALNGQIDFRSHKNPDNKILHTTLVGEMNGFIHALTIGTPLEGRVAPLRPPRAYEAWIADELAPESSGAASETPSPQGAAASAQSAAPFAALPPRPANAPGGREFAQQVANLPLAEREAAVEREILSGNIPDFLRTFADVTATSTGIEGIPHSMTLHVAPDYLAVGSDSDFIRMPMTPQTAQRIAGRLGCSLPTCKIVDLIHAQAALRLEPQPLGEPRQAVETFLKHQELIEQQRAGRATGLLIDGIKKDIVITNHLKEKPDRVAIYGWYYPEGKAIQPLSLVHKNTYMDYSHGVRLVRCDLIADGKRLNIKDVLEDPHLSELISDEGTILSPRIPD